jgi:hypothetical protein
VPSVLQTLFGLGPDFNLIASKVFYGPQMVPNQRVFRSRLFAKLKFGLPNSSLDSLSLTASKVFYGPQIA